MLKRIAKQWQWPEQPFSQRDCEEMRRRHLYSVQERIFSLAQEHQQRYGVNEQAWRVKIAHWLHRQGYVLPEWYFVSRVFGCAPVWIAQSSPLFRIIWP